MSADKDPWSDWAKQETELKNAHLLSNLGFPKDELGKVKKGYRPSKEFHLKSNK